VDAAFAWVGKLAEWFGQFIPQAVIIDTTQGAVKFIRGWKVVALKPGLHVYWPLTTRLRTYATARQSVNLTTQTLITTDDKVIIVGGMVVYEIRDIKAILAETWDPDQTIKDIAMSAVHGVLSQMSMAEIRQGIELGTLQLRLRKRVRLELKKYGVKVLKTMLTDFAPARVLKIIQSTSQDGI